MPAAKGSGGSIRSNLDDVIGDLEHATAETDNIASAALRDAATEIMRHIRENWPLDTGFSYSRFMLEYEHMFAAVVGDAEYTSYVHSGLADRLFAEALAAVGEDVEAFLSNRVLALLDGQS